jgi:hypothetical protein
MLSRHESAGKKSGYPQIHEQEECFSPGKLEIKENEKGSGGAGLCTRVDACQFGLPFLAFFAFLLSSLKKLTGSLPRAIIMGTQLAN